MHSISTSSICGKYERPLAKMRQPARSNSATVASSRLPLGIARLSLGMIHPLVCQRDRLRKAAHRALVAHQSVALDLDAKQQRIVVAVGRRGDDAQAVAARLALHPELVTGAA